jgi:tRNA threonylcarbamoyladenosine biosynthesis protein TsaB
MSEPAVGTPDDLAAELLAQGGETLLVGDGAVRYAEQLGQRPGVEIAGGDLAHPSARSLVQLAHARALREDWIRPHEVELLYLRKPDAEINWSVREGA